uniref:Uncharacterized protein n=1 Tax=Onchocerca volvulus TaxID=6282 RepID=A0A8R1XXN7_ONCVO
MTKVIQIIILGSGAFHLPSAFLITVSKKLLNCQKEHKLTKIGWKIYLMNWDVITRKEVRYKN